MKQKLDFQKAPRQLVRQRENHLQNLEPTTMALPPFASEEENGMMDLTQSSRDEDLETIVAANHMLAHIDLLLPDFDMTAEMKSKTTTLP